MTSIFGDISPGIVSNRKMFRTLLTDVDHLPHPRTAGANHHTRVERGKALAKEFERVIALRDASTIAAVITGFC